ncbi:hypothetical protein PsorP6_015736 [Peronosclerospora sorghi]|uniref:Uncharacterized protein n=1 Tax=Peronosclerospora sorghi TaxID=230839 RepID=A0ACC0WQB8_9STRA|nr:hypothetical protein PsorP6_015736 [Peronosclerospora sorghi]
MDDVARHANTCTHESSGKGHEERGQLDDRLAQARRLECRTVLVVQTTRRRVREHVVGFCNCLKLGGLDARILVRVARACLGPIRLHDLGRTGTKETHTSTASGTSVQLRHTCTHLMVSWSHHHGLDDDIEKIDRQRRRLDFHGFKLRATHFKHRARLGRNRRRLSRLLTQEKHFPKQGTRKHRLKRLHVLGRVLIQDKQRHETPCEKVEMIRDVGDAIKDVAGRYVQLSKKWIHTIQERGRLGFIQVPKQAHANGFNHGSGRFQRDRIRRIGEDLGRTILERCVRGPVKTCFSCCMRFQQERTNLGMHVCVQELNAAQGTIIVQDQERAACNRSIDPRDARKVQDKKCRRWDVVVRGWTAIETRDGSVPNGCTHRLETRCAFVRRWPLGCTDVHGLLNARENLDDGAEEQVPPKFKLDDRGSLELEKCTLRNIPDAKGRVRTNREDTLTNHGYGRGKPRTKAHKTFAKTLSGRRQQGATRHDRAARVAQHKVETRHGEAKHKTFFHETIIERQKREPKDRTFPCVHFLMREHEPLGQEIQCDVDKCRRDPKARDVAHEREREQAHETLEEDHTDAHKAWICFFRTMAATRLLKRGRPGLVASTDATDKIGPSHGLDCLIAIKRALALTFKATDVQNGRRRDEEDHGEPRGHLSWHVTPINDRRVKETGYVQSPRGRREPAAFPRLVHGRATTQ